MSPVTGTPDLRSSAAGLTDVLYRDLTDPTRREQAEIAPFARATGSLGDAFTASCLFHATEAPRWKGLFEKLVGQLAEAVHTRRTDRAGLSNGLTGLLLLLDTADERMTVPPGLQDVLEHRVTVLADQLIIRVRSGFGADRLDYSFSTGLSGIAHRLMVARRDRRLVERICDLFAELAAKPFPDSFWTSTAALPWAVASREAVLTFGARDLSFGMGITGVVSILRRAAAVLHVVRYRNAASLLLDEITRDIDCHGGHGMSRFQSVPAPGAAPLPTAAEGHSWNVGLPGVELAVADDERLMDQLYPHIRYGEEYVDPVAGCFDSPSICSGVAGRLYLADIAGLSDDPRWEMFLKTSLEDYMSRGAGDVPDPGFWEGYGGAVAVWLGRKGGRGYAPVLKVVGAR